MKQKRKTHLPVPETIKEINRKAAKERMRQKHFSIRIKSHSEAPDFEDEVWAKDRTEAISLFKRRHSLALQEWSEEDLERHVDEI